MTLSVTKSLFYFFIYSRNNLEVPCWPFKVEYKENAGHYLVATRDISPKETIMRDTPFAEGPGSKSSPVCLQCSKNAPEYRCSKWVDYLKKADFLPTRMGSFLVTVRPCIYTVLSSSKSFEMHDFTLHKLCFEMKMTKVYYRILLVKVQLSDQKTNN